MHLSSILRVFKSKIGCLFFLLLTHWSSAQNDSLSYRSFQEKVVLFGDLGYASAPFSVFYPFNEDTKRLKYRNNFRPVIGFGIAHKWFAIRLAFSIPIELRSEELYGKTQQLNLGADFTIKKTFFDIDLRSYKGYAIKDAYRWNDSLSESTPNDITGSMNAASFSLNAWYFHNKNYKMAGVRGRTGYYLKETHTWYIKNTLNAFGIGNGNNAVIPDKLHDSLNSRTASNIFTAIDIGIIPGYAYVNRINNWQFSASFGLGPVVQAKFYGVNGQTRGFLGLAPRYDLRLIGGYNVDRYFVMLITDFDNKSIRFNDLKYRQSYYFVRLAAGIRLNSKKGKSKKGTT